MNTTSIVLHHIIKNDETIQFRAYRLMPADVIPTGTTANKDDLSRQRFWPISSALHDDNPYVWRHLPCLVHVARELLTRFNVGEETIDMIPLVRTIEPTCRLGVTTLYDTDDVFDAKNAFHHLKPVTDSAIVLPITLTTDDHSSAYRAAVVFWQACLPPVSQWSLYGDYSYKIMMRMVIGILCASCKYFEATHLSLISSPGYMWNDDVRHARSLQLYHVDEETGACPGCLTSLSHVHKQIAACHHVKMVSKKSGGGGKKSSSKKRGLTSDAPSMTTKTTNTRQKSKTNSITSKSAGEGDNEKKDKVKKPPKKQVYRPSSSRDDDLFLSDEEESLSIVYDETEDDASSSTTSSSSDNGGTMSTDAYLSRFAKQPRLNENDDDDDEQVDMAAADMDAVSLFLNDDNEEAEEDMEDEDVLDDNDDELYDDLDNYGDYDDMLNDDGELPSEDSNASVPVTVLHAHRASLTVKEKSSSHRSRTTGGRRKKE